MDRIFAILAIPVIIAAQGCATTDAPRQTSMLHESFDDNATRDEASRRGQSNPAVTFGYERMMGTISP
jgi:hypothetical protein